jgi:hypothetical protein
VAKATVGGVEVYVTANEVPDEDHPEEPGLRIWHAVTGELLRMTADAVGDRLATTEIAGRAIAVVGGMSDPPKVVDLATGTAAPLPDGGSGVRALTIADVGGAPLAVTAAPTGLIHVTDLTSGSTRTIDCGEPVRAVAAVPSGTGAAVVVAGEDTLHLLDPATGERMTAPAVSGRVGAIATWPGVPDAFAVMLRDGTVWDLSAPPPAQDHVPWTNGD